MNNKVFILKIEMEYFTELTDKISQMSRGELNEDCIKFYENNHQGITYFVKVLKREDAGTIHPTRIKDIELAGLSQLLVKFLNKKQAFQSPLFLEALAALDCILSYMPTTIATLEFQAAFFTNLRRYFIKICGEYEECEQGRKEKFMQFQFYSVFYIIVMFIYQSGKSSDPKQKKIPLQIMNKPFITSLLGIELPGKNKVKKLVAFIMVYLVKKTNVRTWGKRMFEFIINQLENVENKRAIFNYIFCLREISLKINIQLGQIHRNNLMQKLQQIWIQYSDECQIIYLLDLLERILKNYPELCREFFTEDIAIKLGSASAMHISHPLFSDIAVQILTISEHFLPMEYYQKIVYANLPGMGQNELSMRLVNSFIHVLPQKDLLGLVEQGYVEKINQILLNIDDMVKYEGMEILEKFLHLCSRINENVAANVYFKVKPTLVGFQEMIEMKSSVDRLDRMYEKRNLQTYAGFCML